MDDAKTPTSDFDDAGGYAVVMEHYRLKKYRGPEVWARVRVAYEGGESGPSIARRFDVGLSNLRKKARLEGWTRKDIAQKLDGELEPARETAPPPVPQGPPVDPQTAVETAMQRASSLLAQGRGAEAQTLIRSAEALAKLAERAGEAAAAAAEQPSEEEAIAQYMAERDADIIDQATKLAWAMLMDQPMGEAARYSAFMYHWRARHLGPEATACDFAHAVDGGWARRYFDGEGRLRPLPEPITPLAMMVDQHLRLSAEQDQNSARKDPYSMDLDYPGPIRFAPSSVEPGIG